MTRAFLYARQSIDLREGIDRQLERTRKLAEQRGYTVVREYVDNDTSATKARSKAKWPRMLQALRDGEAEVVIAVDMDRLVRSLHDLLDVIDTGAAVLTVDGELDLTTADGEFRAALLASLARFETKRKSERQLRANEHRATSKRPNPQRRRFGYETDARTVRESEAGTVRRIFAAIIAGQSLRSLAGELNAEGITTATGRPWTPVRLRELAQKPYHGGFQYRGEVVLSDEVEPVVSVDDWETANAILADPTRRTSPGNQVKHLLSGIAECGVCGGPLLYMRGYRCRANTSHPFITKAILEPLVVREVARAIATYSGQIREPGERGDVRELVAEYQRLEDRAAAVLSDRDEGLVSAAVARERLVTLREQREAVEARLEAARADDSALVTLHTLARRLDAGQVDAVEARFAELSLDEQRRLVRDLLRIVVDSGRGPGRVHVEHIEAVWLNVDAD